MPPKKKTSAPKVLTDLDVEWFPAYGLRFEALPHVVVYGKSEGEAIARLASFLSDEGRRRGVEYNAKFKNDVFVIE